MGIVNVTPDSFSDGGRHDNTVAAIAHARALIAQGADILDIGGESTRPGAEPVPLQMELDRVLPVIEALSEDAVAKMGMDVARSALAAVSAAQGRPDLDPSVRQRLENEEQWLTQRLETLGR